PLKIATVAAGSLAMTLRSVAFQAEVVALQALRHGFATEKSITIIRFLYSGEIRPKHLSVNLLTAPDAVCGTRRRVRLETWKQT
ncbi:MAG: hypothetical protein M3347_02430, partial [Armatimonadota bacterium]|nr:hypothetical protein [Armatimonadota bacterium]